jgi:hypothetical protein
MSHYGSSHGYNKETLPRVTKVQIMNVCSYLVRLNACEYVLLSTLNRSTLKCVFVEHTLHPLQQLRAHYCEGANIFMNCSIHLMSRGWDRMH